MNCAVIVLPFVSSAKPLEELSRQSLVKALDAVILYTKQLFTIVREDRQPWKNKLV
jgi:hypothetical protein